MKIAIHNMYETSSEWKGIMPGTIWKHPTDGRAWQYCYAGSTALHAGYLGVAAAMNAAHVDEAITEAVAVNKSVLSLTVTAGTAIAENALRWGRFGISYGTGVGHYYMITGNTALTATGTNIVIDIEPGIKVALNTTSRFTLCHNECYGTQESTTAYPPVGAAMVDVTANYWYWAQCRGPGYGYTYTTTTAGYMLQQSVNTAGYLDTKADTETGPTVATLSGTAGINAYFKPVIWSIR